MIRAGLILALALLASAAEAETASERLDRRCQALWQIAVDSLGALTGTYAGVQGEDCVFRDISLDTVGYASDYHMAALRLRGEGLGLPLAEAVPAGPVTLGISVEGLFAYPSVLDPQFDYLLFLQAHRNTIKGEFLASWDPATRVATIDRLFADFRGDNQLSITARFEDVDLTSPDRLLETGAGVKLAAFGLDVTTHGLFEELVAVPLGSHLLPDEGDMNAAVAELRAQAVAGIEALPDTTFDSATRAALVALLGEVPMPSGRLVLEATSDPAFGSARFAGFALTGMPTSAEQVAPLFAGTRVHAEWTHQDEE